MSVTTYPLSKEKVLKQVPDKNIEKLLSGARIIAEIDLDALAANLEAVNTLLGNKKILFAIKADAYGHGAKEIAWELKDKIDMFGVASIDEGTALRINGIQETPILILSPIPYSEIPALFEYRLTPTVTESAFACLLAEEARKRNSALSIHIEVDTGMGRTGIDISEAKNFVYQLINESSLTIEGIFTHFPAADSDLDFTKNQIKEFSLFLTELEKEKGFIAHTANTAAFLNFPESHFDMIRPGLILYGILPRDQHNLGKTISLQPVMSLRSQIVNLRSIPKGRSISYERNYFTSRDSLIAVISAGYGDGYPYNLSNCGKVIINGTRAPIVGNVCMDLTMVDVTDIPGVKIGDVVTLLGEDNNEKITANELADWAKTIPYEITCRISPRVPRAFIKNRSIFKVRNTP